MSLTYGSVCSGIEAATVAWHPLGWTPQFFSEIDAAPRAVLAHHYPEVPLHGDFTTIQAGDFAAIDLLVGGTPCQDFSLAGLRAGLDGERGNLTLEFGRLARRLRPRWFAWENVPGVLSSNGGRDFASVLGLFAGRALGVPWGGWQNAGIVPGIGAAYGLAWRVLDAQYVRVDGFGRAVPQRRRRVFVVGYLGDWRRAAAVLLERAGLCGDLAPRRGQGEIAAASLTSSLGRRCGQPDGGDTEGHLIAHTLRGTGFDASEDGTGRGTPIVPVAGTLCFNGKAAGSATSQDAENGMLVAFDTTQITSAANRSAPQPGDPCHPLAAGAHPPAIAFNSRQDPDVTWDRSGSLNSSSPQAEAVAFQVSESGVRIGDVHATLDANNGPRRHNGVLQGWAVRRLTPLECERLQGFPDGYTLVPHGRGLMADGPRYKALGNSMAVNAMRWIGRRIEAVEAIGASDVRRVA